ncbi:uncharacterized protein [Haliotis asinina]|uniref:uncharacterized protein n=1 Tax=Haliotis asinina TaxID=109174 RepID=UPI0035325F07
MRRRYQMWFLIGSGIIGMLLYIQSMLLAIGHHAHVSMDVFNHQLDFKFRLDKKPQPVHLTFTPQQDVQRNASTQALTQINDESDIPGNKSTYFIKQRFLKHYERAIESGRVPPQWQKELYQRILSNSPPKTQFYLTHLLMIRVYQSDLAKWTYRELKQWMHYMFMIGIEHIYLCEHKHLGDEDMQTRLSQYIHLGLVTYSEVTTKVAMTAQVECYQKWVLLEGNNSKWMTSVDMDEYPYHLQDKEEGFLKRYLEDVEAKRPDISELLMDNYLMLGQGDRSKNMTIDRIRRCTPKPLNKLVKPLFKPACVRPQIHSGVVKKGRRVPANPSQLRMLHYWGARMQKWGPDTEKILQMTEPFTDMVNDWVDRLRNSLLCFGENDAFSNNTGP